MTLNKLGKVELVRTDWSNHYTRMIDNRARSITKHIKMNSELFDILCYFVLRFTNKDEYNKVSSHWIENIKESNKFVNPEELDDLINSLKVAYENSRDDGEISDLRGKILETIYQDKLSPIYSRRDSIFDYGCKVIIDGVEIKYIDESGDFAKNRMTIDIAGYNLENSEFYELKVRPDNFQDNVIKYLNKLRSEALTNRISENVKVGCVTLELRTSLESQLKIIKRKYDIDYEGLEIIGRSEMRELIEMN